MFPTACQSADLYRENIRAVLVFLAFLGQERHRRKSTMNRLGALLFALNRRDVDMTVVAGFVLREVGITLTVGTQTLDIQLLDNHRIFPLEPFAGGQNISVLRNIGATGENNIGSRFADAGRRINIPAMHTRALLFDHLFAENMLADDAVGRGEVEDDLRSLNSQLGGRRQRTPQILADLYTKGISPRAEQQIRSERHFAAPQFNLGNTRSDTSGRVLACRTAAREPAFLIELTGIRQVDLRHYAHYLTVRHDERAVEQVVIHLQRSAHKHNNRLAARIIAQRLQLAHRALLQCLREEQIRTGVTCKAQLRKTDNLHAFRNRLVYLSTYLLGVIAAIRHAHGRHRRRHTYKSKIIRHTHIILRVYILY